MASNAGEMRGTFLSSLGAEDDANVNISFVFKIFLVFFSRIQYLYLLKYLKSYKQKCKNFNFLLNFLLWTKVSTKNTQNFQERLLISLLVLKFCPVDAVSILMTITFTLFNVLRHHWSVTIISVIL